MATTLVVTVTTGCREREASAAPEKSTISSGDSSQVHPPGYVVDSALPPREMLRRFRVGLAPVRALDRQAATSRDELLRRFSAGLSRRDTAALRELTITRAEFAYLYFPETQYTRPPYLMAPDVLWMLMQNRSERGLTRLVSRLGGDELRIETQTCERTPSLEGANRLYSDCTVRFYRADADSTEARRLFGTIIERDGRFKLLSFANDF